MPKNLDITGYFTGYIGYSFFGYSKIPNLVGGWATPLKNMSSSIGMIRNPIYGKIIQMFQTRYFWDDYSHFLFPIYWDDYSHYYQYNPRY